MRDFIEYLEYSENESRKFIGGEKLNLEQQHGWFGPC